MNSSFNSADLDALCWPMTRLGDAIDVLCREAEIGNNVHEITNPHGDYTDSDIGEWITWAMDSRGGEAEPVICSFGDLKQELAAAYPAIFRLSPGRFLAVLSSTRNRLRIIALNGTQKRVPVDHVFRHIAEPLAADHRRELQNLFESGGIAQSRRAKSINFLLEDFLRGERFAALWMLRTAPGAPRNAWLRKTGLVRGAAGIVLAHTGEYLLWLLSWALIGTLSLDGTLDRGWLIAWALLLFTLMPLRLYTTWKQGTLAIGMGGMLKARLLHGSMRLRPDELRSKGAGAFLTQALEAETIETLALGNGVEGLLSIVELIVAGGILGWTSFALLACLAAAALAIRRFASSHAEWSEKRFEITHHLVDAMVGHRTRLVQQPREEWHETEDQTLNQYLRASSKFDRLTTALSAALPRCWLVIGIACLSPAIASGNRSPSETAVELGGVLLAYTALKRMTTSLTELAAIGNAWKRVAPLFAAAGRKQNAGSLPAAAAGKARCSETLLEAERLSFRYHSGHRPVLEGCSLAIHAGDKILLEGLSGGGKSTLASVLTGMREPDSGLLLLRGLDRQTAGDERWRRHAAAAPQFHENHILTETLAFNLLMGRRWPPSESDLQEAELLARDLGLGPLLDTMPAGLMQLVGEGGWQLSHGERSRIFLARALLQNAAVTILDESFAALDPENLKTALDCALDRAETLVVIAHP
ncbi:MAG TPA: ATP-binding cassette domain-containing protein [Bryobacteraceae bacterium]|nr:ATP-binding cassette domain-containing protein [Bryobacteraceae bacterium]